MTDTWDSIADWYADHVHRGSAMHQFARDVLLDVLPADMSGQRVLDMGCGEGLITRAVAGRGAHVIGVDPTVRLIERARAIEATAATGATYRADDGSTLATVVDGWADWVTAGLSLNNVPDLNAAIASIRRALASGGRLAFTVPHPCFEAPHARWVGAERVIGSYSTEGFWRSRQSTRRAPGRQPPSNDLALPPRPHRSWLDPDHGHRAACEPPRHRRATPASRTPTSPAR
jgi:SAM-dependent methyltransferase